MRAADRLWIAADRRAVLVQGPRERIGLLHRGRARRPHIAAPDVGVLGDDAQRPLRPVAADPDRRVWLLYRLRLGDRVREPVVAPLERRAWRGPQELQDA